MQPAKLKQLFQKIKNEAFVVSGKAIEGLETIELEESLETDIFVYLVNKCLAPSTSYQSRLEHKKVLHLALRKGLKPTGRVSNGLTVFDAIFQYDLVPISPALKFNYPTLPLSISLKGKLGTLIKLAARMRQGENAETLLKSRNSPFALANALTHIERQKTEFSGVSLSEVLQANHATTHWSVRPSDISQGYKLQLHPSLPKTFRHSVHDTVISYHPSALQALMQAGVSSSFRDFFGRTPNHLAEIVDARGCREILLDYPTSQLDNFGRSVEQTRSWLHQRHQEICRYRQGEVGGWDQDVDTKLHIDSCDIDVVDGASFSFKRFLSDYVSCLKPVLIRGGISRWTELQRRWKKQQFVQRYGGYSVISGGIPYAGTFGFGAHKKALQRSATGLDDYVFSPINRRQHPALFEDLKLIGSLTKLACTHWQLYQGVAGTGAPMHLHMDAWNALVYGRKRWMVLPPSQARYSLLGPLEFLQREKDRLQPLEWVQEAGDICYIPRYWSHAVLNLQECVGVATEFSSPYIG